MQFIFCVAPRCPRGSLVPYQNEENQFHPVLALLGAGAPMVWSAGQDLKWDKEVMTLDKIENGIRRL